MSDYYSSLSASSHGVSGLASGMDTESMVNKLLSGTKSKIQQQESAKQQILWRQMALRSDINLIKSFQLKYMSFTHPESNLLSSQFFQQMSANFTSNKINAVATAHSTGGSVKIDKIEQLASAATLKGENNVSGDLTGIIDAAAIKALDKNSTVNFDLDGVVKTVTLSAAAVGNYAEGSVEALAQNLTNALSQGFGSGITMKIDGGKLSIGTKAGEGRQITVSSTKEGGVKALSVLGLKDGASNKLNYGVALRDLNFKKGVVGDRFAFKINGVEIKATADESLGTVINRINQSDAGVKISYSNLTDSFTMTRTQTGAGLDIKLEQTEGNILDSLFSAGQSSGVTGVAPKTNPLIGTGAVDATAFKDGGEFKYQLNGKSYTITLDPKADKTDYTQEEVLKKINDVMATQHKLASNGKANVRIEGGATASEPFKIVTEHGYSVAFDAAEAAGDLTKGMGFVEGQKQTSNKDTALSELGLKGKFTLASVYQEQQSDGSWKNTTTAVEVDLDALVAGAKNLGDLTIALNDKIKSFKNPDGSASYANAKVEIDATTGAISISGIDKAASPTQDTSLKILGGTYNPDGTGGTYNPEGSESLKKLFGTDNISMGSKAVGNTVEEGKNAKLTVNGVAIERNTNNFTVEGVDLTIKETSTEAIEIKVTQNTEDFTKGIEGFVNDYNKLIEGLNKQIDAEASYKKYPPLTKEQQKEMTDSEIKDWNEKAQEGLLRGDSSITSILADMRAAIYDKPEGAKFALYEIGITTSGNYKDRGKLILDKDALNKAMASDPDEVRKLFTDSKKGVAKQLNSIIDEATKPGYNNINSLVKKAGTTSSQVDDETTLLGKQVSDRNKKIENLKRSYDSEYSRYWKQFTAMEKMIQQMNSQSSWLTQQLG